MAKRKCIRVSYSGLDKFKECPQKYWNNKTHEMRNQSSAFGFGSAFEAGVNRLFQGATFPQAYKEFKEQWTVRPANKWEGAKEIYDSETIFYYQSDYDSELLTALDLKMIKLWYQEIFNKESKGDELVIAEEVLQKMKDGGVISKEERQFTHRVLWMCCRRRGYHMLKAFEQEILPTVEEVVEMQKEIEMTSPEGDKITGFIDYIVRLVGDKRLTIMDLKSAGREYEDHAIESSDQLASYALAEDIPRVGYWIVLKKMSYKVNCDKCNHLRENGRLKNCEKCKGGKYTIRKAKGSTQTLFREVKEHRLDSVASDYSSIITAIDKGISWKNPHSCMNYGTKCEFYDSCWGGKKLDDLEHLKKKGEK